MDNVSQRVKQLQQQIEQAKAELEDFQERGCSHTNTQSFTYPYCGCRAYVKRCVDCGKDISSCVPYYPELHGEKDIKHLDCYPGR